MVNTRRSRVSLCLKVGVNFLSSLSLLSSELSIHSVNRSNTVENLTQWKYTIRFTTSAEIGNMDIRHFLLTVNH